MENMQHEKKYVAIKRTSPGPPLPAATPQATNDSKSLSELQESARKPALPKKSQASKLKDQVL